MKTVRVLGPTGATGLLQPVHILSDFTGPTGTLPIWLQAATGATGFKNVVDATGMTGPNGEIKTVIISGYTGPN